MSDTASSMGMTGTVRVFVSVPVASFRVAQAREYWESYPLPAPATVFGMLLAFIGEELRLVHAGAELAIALCSMPSRSLVLRTLWRVKEKNYWEDPVGRTHVISAASAVRGSDKNPGTWTDPDGQVHDVRSNTKEQRLIEDWARIKGWDVTFTHGLGLAANKTPGLQELLCGVTLSIWVRPGKEPNAPGGRVLASRVRAALEDPLPVVRFGGLSLGESTHLVNDLRPWRPDANRRAPADPQDGRLLLPDPKGDLSLPVWPDHVGSAGTRFGQYRLADLTQLPESPPESAWTTIEPPVQ